MHDPFPDRQTDRQTDWRAHCSDDDDDDDDDDVIMLSLQNDESLRGHCTK